MRRLCLLVLLAPLAAACATSGAVPRPYPGTPRLPSADAGRVPASADAPVPPPPSPAPSPLAGAIVDTARSLLGTAYRNGGSDPGGFDCSGFVQWVFGSVGIRLPRSVREQWEAGSAVPPDAVEPGDLVFFAIDGDTVSHVGIVLEDGRFVHAPSARGVVRVERLASGYWARRYAGARRMAAPPTSAGDRLPLAAAPARE